MSSGNVLAWMGQLIAHAQEAFSWAGDNHFLEHLLAGQGLHQGNLSQAQGHQAGAWRLAEEATWQTYITRLREENRRLRALRKELDSAGLSHLPSESE